MKRFFFLGILFLSLSASAQNSATDKFYNYFADAYIELSRPPLNNYLVNLNNTIKVSFSTEHPFFEPALKELAARYKISEADAADSLYNISLRRLTDQKLWANFTDIYNENVTAFKAYTDALCPCVAANYSDTDRLQKMMPVIQRCVAGLASDTASLSKIQLAAGNKTINDVFKKQQYFSLYIYQHCPTVNSAMSQTLRAEAYTNYVSIVSVAKGNRVANVLNYYRDKKMDSLAIIFPTYKKFSKELNEALLLLQTKDARTASYAFSDGDERNAIVSFYTNEASLGEVMASFASNDIGSVVTKITFTKEQPAASAGEVKEDVAVPVKQ